MRTGDVFGGGGGDYVPEIHKHLLFMTVIRVFTLLTSKILFRSNASYIAIFIQSDTLLINMSYH